MLNIDLYNLYQYKESPIVVNVDEKTFQGGFKMGDMVALLNVVQDVRNKSNNNIKFHSL